MNNAGNSVTTIYNVINRCDVSGNKITNQNHKPFRFIVDIVYNVLTTDQNDIYSFEDMCISKVILSNLYYREDIFKEEYSNSWQDWLKCLDFDREESKQYRAVLDITYTYSEDYLGDLNADYEIKTLIHYELKD